MACPTTANLTFEAVCVNSITSNESAGDDGESSESSIETHQQWNYTLTELPIDMQFNEGHLLAIIIYSILMLISAVGNLYVLITILKQRSTLKRLTRINRFLLHLVIADLLVTFLMMPLEIVWNVTVSWHGGDFMCRIMSFFRTFGLYLSGFILICISIDCYFAVVKPLSIQAGLYTRGKTLLLTAWISSALCSLPQFFIFHVERHPVFHWYQQCVTFNSFPSPEYELADNLFGFMFLYAIPMTLILVCYSRILITIYRMNALKSSGELRRSNVDALSRAKCKTLKMTITVIVIHFTCWGPYNVMSLWYWFDRASAQQVDQRVQKGLFLFACTNSCMNPLIYGLFHCRRNTRDNCTRTRIPESVVQKASSSYQSRSSQSNSGKLQTRVRSTGTHVNDNNKYVVECVGSSSISGSEAMQTTHIHNNVPV